MNGTEGKCALEGCENDSAFNSFYCAQHGEYQELTMFREAREARRPRPPAELVDALQDSVHKEIGEYRTGKSVKEKP